MRYDPRPGVEDEQGPIASLYKPLKRGQIRLIEIEGFGADYILRCSLRHVLLASSGNSGEPVTVDEIADISVESSQAGPGSSMRVYTAISYTWDPEDRIWYDNYKVTPKPIWLDDKVAVVSDKVANILAFMHKHGRQYIWMDAICINQYDLDEKGAQVRQMGDVYARASEVVCILGSPTHATDSAIDTANCYATGQIEQIERSGEPYRGLVEIFTNKYWQRAWILQEISLGHHVNVFCGSRRTTLQVIQKTIVHVDFPEGFRSFKHPRLVLYLRMKRHRSKYHFRALANPIISSETIATGSFLDVLKSGRCFKECSNPRDLLYSRLALASDSTRLIPQLDYNLRVEDVYRSFAVNCILETGSLDILPLARPSILCLPSWVPDWSNMHDEDDWKGFACLFPDADQHIWAENGRPRISESGYELHVQGRSLYITGRTSLSSIIKTDYELLRRSVSDVIHLGGSGGFTFSKAIPGSEAETTRTGDLLCVLKGCPCGVYLRRYSNHYELVARVYGRDPLLSHRKEHIAAHRSGSRKANNVASLPFGVDLSAEYVNSCPEQSFNIR